MNDQSICIMKEALGAESATFTPQQLERLAATRAKARIATLPQPTSQGIYFTHFLRAENNQLFLELHLAHEPQCLLPFNENSLSAEQVLREEFRELSHRIQQENIEYLRSDESTSSTEAVVRQMKLAQKKGAGPMTIEFATGPVTLTLKNPPELKLGDVEEFRGEVRNVSTHAITLQSLHRAFERKKYGPAINKSTIQLTLPVWNEVQAAAMRTAAVNAINQKTYAIYFLAQPYLGQDRKIQQLDLNSVLEEVQGPRKL